MTSATSLAPRFVRTKLDASRLTTSHRWLQFLPDGKHFLFYAEGTAGPNTAAYAGSLEGSELKLLIPNDSKAVYVESGYLLFIRQGTLMAQRFDADSLRGANSSKTCAVSTPPGRRITGLPKPPRNRVRFDRQPSLIAFNRDELGGWFFSSSNRCHAETPGNVTSEES